MHKSKGIDIKAITEKKFFALFQNNSDKKDAIQYSSITDIDSFVGCIGEYTGQFSIEGKGVCLIDLPWRYIDTTKKDTDDYKLLTTKIGAVFQPKNNCQWLSYEIKRCKYKKEIIHKINRNYSVSTLTS